MVKTLQFICITFFLSSCGIFHSTIRKENSHLKCCSIDSTIANVTIPNTQLVGVKLICNEGSGVSLIHYSTIINRDSTASFEDPHMRLFFNDSGRLVRLTYVFFYAENKQVSLTEKELRLGTYQFINDDEYFISSNNIRYQIVESLPHGIYAPITRFMCVYPKILEQFSKNSIAFDEQVYSSYPVYLHVKVFEETNSPNTLLCRTYHVQGDSLQERFVSRVSVKNWKKGKGFPLNIAIVDYMAPAKIYIDGKIYLHEEIVIDSK